MFKKSLKDLFKNPIAAVPVIISGLIVYFFTSTLLSSYKLGDSSYISELQDPSKAAVLVLGLITSFLIVVVIYLFITPFIQAWSGLMCRSLVNDEKPGFTESLKKSFKYYWRMLGVIVLSVMIIFGVYVALSIVLGLPIMILVQSTSPAGMSAGVIMLLVIVGLIFVLAMLFIMICLLPVQPLLIYDDMGVVDALSKGFKFGLKRFFPILGVFLLFTVITAVLASIFNAISPYAEYLAVVITSFLGLFNTIFIMNIYRKYKAETLLDVQQVPNEGIYAEQENMIDDQYEEPSEAPDEETVIREADRENEEDDPRKKFTI